MIGVVGVSPRVLFAGLVAGPAVPANKTRLVGHVGMVG
jgi:hypothetical protein